jgi:hypothetical protein
MEDAGGNAAEDAAEDDAVEVDDAVGASSWLIEISCWRLFTWTS